MKNHKWAVEMKVYDIGRVSIAKPFKVDFSAEPSHKEGVIYDYYFDVFLTKKEAQDFYEENINS